MSFQIHALPAEGFAALFSMSDDALRRCRARRHVADAKPGFPCRVSLADAEPGETVILVNYQHQPADTPYRASHAIFVREGVAQARPPPGTVPQVLTGRLISVRAFDDTHFLVGAEVVDGGELATTIPALFENPAVAYLHLHNALPGCYAARVTRAG